MLLLDTHVLVWMSEDAADLPAEVGRAIDEASNNGGVFVSPMTFWEIAMLESRRRLTLQKPIHDWMNDVLGMPGLALAPFTPSIAIDSTRLPGEFHRDPADQIIVATARFLGAMLVTHDRHILRYGAAGHLDVMAA